MIKTTELMLGNIIEYKNAYVQVINLAYGDLMIRHNGVRVAVVESDINPIPLTESVLKRLGIESIGFESIHQLQNHRTNNQRKPIDITPLLAPRYTTHDGVEVWEEDLVWRCKIENPTNLWKHAINKNSPSDCYSFSTQQACQSYIDKVTRKPIFTTKDGVDVFEGDEYWYCYKSGFDVMGNKDSVTYVKVYSNWRPIDDCIRFSTEQLAQAYLNKVWAEKEYNDLINKK